MNRKTVSTAIGLLALTGLVVAPGAIAFYCGYDHAGKYLREHPGLWHKPNVDLCDTKRKS